MKKGELRKLEYLQAAEILFCRKGYESTSVQDILDCLNASKGSFYHHFVSKESLLEQICIRRAEQIYTSAASAAEKESFVTAKLNTLLSGMIPLRDEKISFLLMLLPVFRLPEGRSVRECYCQALAGLFRDDLARYLGEGINQGTVVYAAPDIDSDILTVLINHLWVSICRMILSAEESGTDTDLTECLRCTERVRNVAERMLSLPYGSLDLIDLATLKSLCEQIHAHWAR